MTQYTVELSASMQTVCTTVDVEADSESEAIEIAKQEASETGDWEMPARDTVYVSDMHVEGVTLNEENSEEARS